MLDFFRRYQRFFFLIITVMIVISFLFFGAFSSFNTPAETPDRVVGKGIGGADITQKNLSTLYHLIESSPLDRSGLQKGKIPNLFNDSVVEKELLSTGMAMMLARHYFEDLKPDLEKRLTSIRNYRPYVHPNAPSLSAEAVWHRFSPNIAAHLNLLKNKSDQFTLETLAVMFQLYLNQAMLPPDIMKQLLIYQENQKGIKSDPLLANTDLSLFGFHSMEDWFGPRFIELSSQFILNASLYAKQKGYEVTNEEVRMDLFQNIASGYQELSQQGKINSEELQSYYRTQLHNLGVDETTALESWRQVMLFRRLFQDVGNSVFIDPLAFKQFQSYSKDGIKVDLYELPSYLQLADIRSIFKLQMYLDGVSADRQKSSLQLPLNLASIDQIEKRAPELVEQQFEIEYTHVNKTDLMREISLKQTWDWQGQENNWALLKKEFSELSSIKTSSSAERIAALDRLDKNLRLKIDQFARSKMIDARTEMITVALQKSNPHSQSLRLRSRGGPFPFTGIQDQAALVSLLRSAPLKDSQPDSHSPLNCYSQDGTNFYQISVIARAPHQEMLQFERASKDGTLDRMLDKRLEEAYPDARRRDHSHFQQVDGTWKPFAEVKDQVGRFVFADLLRAIEESYRVHFGALPTKDLPSSFYTQYRLFDFISQAKAEIEKNPEDSSWIRSSEDDSQWKLVKTTRVIDRSTALPFKKDQFFTIAPEGWSAIETGLSGALAFCRVLGKDETHAKAVEEMTKGHQILSVDTKRNLMIDLLKLIAEEKAIDLSMSGSSHVQ